MRESDDHFGSGDCERTAQRGIPQFFKDAGHEFVVLATTAAIEGCDVHPAVPCGATRTLRFLFFCHASKLRFKYYTIVNFIRQLYFKDSAPIQPRVASPSCSKLQWIEVKLSRLTYT